MPFRYPRAVALKTVYLSFGTISYSLGKSKARSWVTVRLPGHRGPCCAHQGFALNAACTDGFNDRVHLLEPGARICLAGYGQLPWRFPAPAQLFDDSRDARPTIRDRRTRQTSDGTRQTCRGTKYRRCPFQSPTVVFRYRRRRRRRRHIDTMAVETQTMPALNGHAFDGDTDMTKEPALRFTSGLILPPPEIKCKPSSSLEQYLVVTHLFSCHR